MSGLTLGVACVEIVTSERGITRIIRHSPREFSKTREMSKSSGSDRQSFFWTEKRPLIIQKKLVDDSDSGSMALWEVAHLMWFYMKSSNASKQQALRVVGLERKNCFWQKSQAAQDSYICTTPHIRICPKSFWFFLKILLQVGKCLTISIPAAVKQLRPTMWKIPNQKRDMTKNQCIPNIPAITCPPGKKKHVLGGTEFSTVCTLCSGWLCIYMAAKLNKKLETHWSMFAHTWASREKDVRIFLVCTWYPGNVVFNFQRRTLLLSQLGNVLLCYTCAWKTCLSAVDQEKTQKVVYVQGLVDTDTKNANYLVPVVHVQSCHEHAQGLPLTSSRQE